MPSVEKHHGRFVVPPDNAAPLIVRTCEPGNRTHHWPQAMH
jgi:hypothetical protein